MTLAPNAQLIADAYRRMASEARYRPAAPSDGFGNITVPIEELDLDAEIATYCERFTAEEDEGEYRIGCTTWETAIATVFTIEAARCFCGAAPETARRLLTLALEELNG